MLRPLLASLLASALVLLACSTSSAPDGDPTSEDPVTGDPDGTNGPSGTVKKKKGTSSGGTSGGASTSGDPGGTSSSGGTPAAPANTVSDKVDISEVQVTVNNQGRRYLLAVPKNYDANKAYPLIVALHGDGGSADAFVAESKITMASTDQAIVAFPDQVVDLFTSYNSNADQRLVAAAIAQTKKDRNIDAGKIWGFGYSKGAFMLNEFACRKPGLFTAIAPHAGGAPQEQDDDGNVNCPNAQAINVFATMGTDDDLEGGQFEADYWAEQAGCGGGTTTGQPNFCQSYKNCSDAKVVFCKLANHGHFPLYDTAAADSWAFFNSL